MRTAKDDYPPNNYAAPEISVNLHYVTYQDMCDEIDFLRAEVDRLEIS